MVLFVKFTVQTHIGSHWSDAAEIAFDAPNAGIEGPTKIAYDMDYFFSYVDMTVDASVKDRRALSVRLPVNLETVRLPRWPSWLLDLAPSGVAREHLAKEFEMRPDDPAVEMPLIRRVGATPIGNLRIKEAWEDEVIRLRDVVCPPLTDADIERRTERFMDVITRFAFLASGSKGVQGEWPKALLTRATDGAWYPDPFVETDTGLEHAIVKVLQSPNREDELIVASEAPYLEIARRFGLRVAAPLSYSNGVLKIPRFDRSVIDGVVIMHGQESLVSAHGVAEFGYVGAHEDYLGTIREMSDDPVGDTIEYVLRDMLNTAMGNPDNHGRNTAFQKDAAGGVRLSPLYDFAPMRLSRHAIARSTRWKCLYGKGAINPWPEICAAAAFRDLSADTIKHALCDRLPLLHELPALALDAGVPREVVEDAFDVAAVTAAIERMCDGKDDIVRP
jgi:serine/threonine-protein kinase HipA